MRIELERTEENTDVFKVGDLFLIDWYETEYIVMFVRDGKQYGLLCLDTGVMVNLQNPFKVQRESHTTTLTDIRNALGQPIYPLLENTVVHLYVDKAE